MNTDNPQISVVIPAYNQAQYLAGTIQSVLAQTHKDYEIIVVDDGSTDNTASVAKQFGSTIRYIHQENQGLAGARNTGIRNARGTYVALLDSDDLWLPSYLKSMISLARERPEATVYYCGVFYIDAYGNDLAQRGTTKPIPSEEMYATMLRANHLIPSTILMRRLEVIEAGLFDITFRRLQDWELWIRLLRQGHTFVGFDGCLIRYRVHDKSLSTDPTGGQRAATALIEKHFGIDDGQWQTWPADKRRAYGGLYSYHALTSVLRQNDWGKGGRYIRQALLADPTIAEDPDIFYELALGTQPPGYRGTSSDNLNLEENAQNLEIILANIFDQNSNSALASLRRRTYGTAYYAIGLLAYNNHLLMLARSYLWRALIADPRSITGHQQLMPTLGKSIIKPFLGKQHHQQKLRKSHIDDIGNYLE